MQGPHPGWLSIRCGGGTLLLLRLIGEVVLILQHLHFQHLTHHVSACAAQRREQVSREGGERKDHGGRWRGEEINRVTHTQNLTVRLCYYKKNQDYSTLGRKNQKHKRLQATFQLNVTFDRVPCWKK